jgi:HlyD family secretion protein
VLLHLCFLVDRSRVVFEKGAMTMRKALALTLFLFLALLALVGCEASQAGIDAETAAAAPLAQELDDVVSATGLVQPARWANLSFPTSGTVDKIHGEQGQAVVAGEQLAELEAVQLERTVAEAQAALSVAEASLAQVLAGAHPQDIAAAEEAVAAAQANAGVVETQITAAEMGLAQARSGVAIAQAQEAIAQGGVKVAQAELSRAQAGVTEEERTVAKAALEKARAAVQHAQSAYDRVGGRSDSPQALVLEQATLDLEIAQADYDRLAGGPRAADLAPLRASVESAGAQVLLAQAQVAQAGSQVGQAQVAVDQAGASLEAAEAQVAQTRAHLDRLRAGATPEEVAVAEAAVQQAQARLNTAQAVRDQAVLTAPFDGTVGLVSVREGEEALAGQTVLVLGDLSTLRVETTDLDEIDVARLQPGQQVDLTFDALPDKVLSGHIVRVAPMSAPGQSAATYTVIIEFEEPDPALRWGMTAFVDIWVE